MYHEFINHNTQGFVQWRDHVRAVDWEVVTETTGLSRGQITEAAQMLRESDATVFCWAMGLTQHRNAVATIKEVVNVALAQGNIGKRGAGLFPVRGHSNVQGDRTMGIWERPPAPFLDSLEKEFGFNPPRLNGYDTVDSVRALRDGEAHFFLGLGGNFVQAVSDSDVVAEAMRKARMTVHVSTKLNRSHLVCGDTALILPTKGRTEKDIQASGPQWISVEDSTCSVHASRGPLEPASPHVKSEVEIVCRIAEATIGDRYGINWKEMRENYSEIRLHISRVVAGCESYEVNVRRPGGFVLPHPPRDSRTFHTSSGKAEFVVSPIDVLQVPDGHVVLQTLRSHDQFNTTIYGLSDRYRGVEGGRQVIFLHRNDIAGLGFRNGDLVDIVTKWDGDNRFRCAEAFRIVEYPPQTHGSPGGASQLPDLHVDHRQAGAGGSRPAPGRPGRFSGGDRRRLVAQIDSRAATPFLVPFGSGPARCGPGARQPGPTTSGKHPRPRDLHDRSTAQSSTGGVCWSLRPGTGR